MPRPHVLRPWWLPCTLLACLAMESNACTSPDEDASSYEITAEWVAPGGAEERRFGRSVAIEGNVIAAATDRGEDGSLVPGSVHLIASELPGTPVIATIQAPAREWPDDFGGALAFAKSQLLVGAPGDAEFGWDAGAAWIFNSVNDAWQLTDRLEPVEPEGGSRFGAAVACDGATAVIGAPRSDELGLDSGIAHVFEYKEGDWQATAQLTAPDGEEADFFGSSVALDGDWIAIGAWGDDDNGEKTGAVWLFNRIRMKWHAITKIVPKDAIARDRFGCTVAFAGGDLLVSASGRMENRGIVHVFRNGKNGWDEVDRLLDPQGEHGDWFGYAIAARGNLLIVGAPGANGATEIEGRIALFERHGQDWVARGTLNSGPPTGEQPIQFGWSVATDGMSAAVGRIDDADGPDEPGRVWLVESRTGLRASRLREVLTDP